MWIKLFLGCAVVAFCVFGGYLAGGKWRARKRFFEQFARFNERYLTELDYSRKPLSAFLEGQDYAGEFKRAADALKKREAPDFSRDTFLTAEERTETENYFGTIGKGDTLSQRNYFAAKRKWLETKKEESEGEAKKRGALYLKLGLLAGLAVVILIL